MDNYSDYITSFSEDERIAQYLLEIRKVEESKAEQEERERRILFDEYYNTIDNEDTIFQLDGMAFLKFCHTKIKFTFQPHKVANVSKKIIFYCTLRYRKNNWIPRRDTFPANYKLKIYNLFYRSSGFIISDDNVINVIYHIHKILMEWSKEHEAFRLRKYKDYINGVDVVLDSDDEEIFLNKQEIENIHQKRNKILKRMLLPERAPYY